MPEKLPYRKRKQILVEKKIQYRFARFVMMFVGVAALVTGTVIFFSILILMGDKLAAVYPQGRLAPIIRSVYLAFFAILLVSSPVIWYACIKFSFRIVGPLPKTYRYLRDIGHGIYPGLLRYRKYDELQDLAKAVNDMADELKARGVIKESEEPSQSPPA